MSNQKRFSKIAIIIIVLVLLGGAYFVFNKKDKNITARNTENQSDQSSSSIGGDLSMSDWKTYRNEKYGFEIKYPPSFLVDENFYGKAAGAEFSLSFGPPYREVFGSDHDSLKSADWYRLIIETYRLKKQETLESYAQSDQANSDAEKFKEIIIGGERAITVKTHASFEDDPKDYVVYYTYSSHNDLIFKFVDDSILRGRNKNVATNTYTQIFSTIKFTK